MSNNGILDDSFKAKMYVLNELNYYKILGVEPNSDIDTISKEYRILAKQFHPDKHHSLPAAEKAQLVQIFQKITSSFNALKDPETRKKHDFELRINEKREIKVPEIKLSNSQNHTSSDNLRTGNISFTFTQMKPVDLDQIRSDKAKKDNEKANQDFEQAQKLFAEKKYDEAINILRALTEKFSAVAKYHSYLGLAMLEKGWSGYAQAEFKVALHFDPKDEIALKKYVSSGSKKEKEEKEEKIDLNSTQNLKSVIGKFKSMFNR